MQSVPNFLADYADLYHQNPRAATLKWFSEARFGLLMPCYKFQTDADFQPYLDFIHNQLRDGFPEI